MHWKGLGTTGTDYRLTPRQRLATRDSAAETNLEVAALDYATADPVDNGGIVNCVSL